MTDIVLSPFDSLDRALIRRIAEWIARHPKRQALKEAFDVAYAEALLKGVEAK